MSKEQSERLHLHEDKMGSKKSIEIRKCRKVKRWINKWGWKFKWTHNAQFWSESFREKKWENCCDHEVTINSKVKEPKAWVGEKGMEKIVVKWLIKLWNERRGISHWGIREDCFSILIFTNICWTLTLFSQILISFFVSFFKLCHVNSCVTMIPPLGISHGSSEARADERVHLCKYVVDPKTTISVMTSPLVPRNKKHHEFSWQFRENLSGPVKNATQRAKLKRPQRRENSATEDMINVYSTTFPFFNVLANFDVAILRRSRVCYIFKMYNKNVCWTFIESHLKPPETFKNVYEGWAKCSSIFW